MRTKDMLWSQLNVGILLWMFSAFHVSFISIITQPHQTMTIDCFLGLEIACLSHAKKKRLDSTFSLNGKHNSWCGSVSAGLVWVPDKVCSRAEQARGHVVWMSGSMLGLEGRLISGVWVRKVTWDCSSVILQDNPHYVTEKRQHLIQITREMASF